MGKHKDGLDGIGAKPGDSVRVAQVRDDGDRGPFRKGMNCVVGVAPNGDPCIWTAGGKGTPVMPWRGFGVFFEITGGQANAG
jgi:hypothetical protein